jgi:hypothetical protein
MDFSFDSMKKFIEKALKDTNNILDKRLDRLKLEDMVKNLDYDNPSSIKDLIKVQDPLNPAKRDLDYDIFKKIEKISDSILKKKPVPDNLQGQANLDLPDAEDLSDPLKDISPDILNQSPDLKIPSASEYFDASNTFSGVFPNMLKGRPETATIKGLEKYDFSAQPIEEIYADIMSKTPNKDLQNLNLDNPLENVPQDIPDRIPQMENLKDLENYDLGNSLENASDSVSDNISELEKLKDVVEENPGKPLDKIPEDVLAKNPQMVKLKELKDSDVVKPVKEISEKIKL